MSIRRIIFTSGQNLKRPFLCQYLIFFNNFFLHWGIHLDHNLNQKNRNLKKIVDLKVYCNLTCSLLFILSEQYRTLVINNNSSHIDFIFVILKRPLYPAVSTAILGGLPKLTQYNYLLTCTMCAVQGFA